MSLRPCSALSSLRNMMLSWVEFFCPIVFDFCPFWYLLGRTFNSPSMCWFFTERIMPVCGVLPVSVRMLRQSSADGRSVPDAALCPLQVSSGHSGSFSKET